MQHSKLSIAVALALLCAGCGRQATVSTNPTIAATRAAESSAAPDPVTQCKAWGIQPDSPGYKQCVDGMNEAANATAGAGGPQRVEQAQAEGATMRADMAHQSDEFRRQLNDQMKAAASNPKCITVTNGTNTSTSCPD